MSEMVKLEYLNKDYSGFQALRNVNLSLDKGKIIGLLGPNGSGKTTLIKILTGMTLQYTGSVSVNGRKLDNDSKAVIAYLPDQLYFDRWMRIKDLEKYYEDMFSNFNKRKFRELIQKFRIEDRVFVRKLSKGNQEKLQLALVLAREAQLYIFDEPIGGVDPALRQIILDTIMEYRNTDATVILSTHQIYDVEDLFDEVIFLKDGEVYLHRNTKELLEEKQTTLLELFKEVFKYAH
ncbi:MAG: ABC transporter ATP-binding protein [Candidatus Izemoplasmatales bacterium]